MLSLYTAYTLLFKTHVWYAFHKIDASTCSRNSGVVNVALSCLLVPPKKFASFPTPKDVDRISKELFRQ